MSAARSELAPTGKLRVAIAVGPTPGTLFAAWDKASGQYRGASAELGRALAAHIDVPVELVAYANSGQIVAAASHDAWDVTFVPVDEERKKTLAFGSPYCLLQSTYLVASASGIAKLSDIDHPAMRVVGIEGTATIRASARTSPRARHIAVAGPTEAIGLMLGNKADAMAFGREELVAIASEKPALKVLDGGFMNTTIAVAVFRERAAALVQASAFIDEAVRSGLMRRIFDDIGASTSQVAPVGMKP